MRQETQTRDDTARELKRSECVWGGWEVVVVMVVVVVMEDVVMVWKVGEGDDDVYVLEGDCHSAKCSCGWRWTCVY